MTELILLRHGATLLNEKGAYCGRTDPPLSARGVAETKRAAKALRSFAPQHVYTSGLRRAVHSAQIVAPQAATVCEALRELDFGAFEGLTAEDAAQSMPQAWRGYLEHPLAFQFPGGESVPCFLLRAAQAVTQLAARHGGRRVLVVTHKGVILAALSRLLHGDLTHGFCYDIRPSGFARLIISGESAVLTQIYGV